jgi:hypothetical protein
VAGGAALVVLLLLGFFVVLPRFTEDRSTAAATATLQRGLDLLRQGDYGGYYDLLDRASQAQMSRENFIPFAECLRLDEEMNRRQDVVVRAVTIESDDIVTVFLHPVSGRDAVMDVRWEGHRWRIHHEFKYSVTTEIVSRRGVLCRK